MANRLTTAVLGSLLLLVCAAFLSSPLLPALADADRCASADRRGEIDERGPGAEERDSLWPPGYTCASRENGERVTRFSAVGPAWLPPVQAGLVGVALLLPLLAAAAGITRRAR